MSSSFTFLNALPIIMVATKKTSKPWEPSPYYSRRKRRGGARRSRDSPMGCGESKPDELEDERGEQLAAQK